MYKYDTWPPFSWPLTAQAFFHYEPCIPRSAGKRGGISRPGEFLEETKTAICANSDLKTLLRYGENETQWLNSFFSFSYVQYGSIIGVSEHDVIYNFGIRTSRISTEVRTTPVFTQKVWESDRFTLRKMETMVSTNFIINRSRILVQ